MTWIRKAAGRRVVAVAAAMVAAALTGCDDPRARLVGHAEVAGAPATGGGAGGVAGGRAAAADGLKADFDEGRITLDLALDHAFVTIERGEDQFAYVGAVLDFAQQIEGSIPRQAETSTLLLMRIGRLAFQGAEAAYRAGDVAMARSLVLAGPARWQSEAYWLRYPDHDALSAMLLAMTGDRQEALRRLASRPVLEAPADEAFTLIRQLSP